jgi:transcriptional regulator with XRE-family HTH domain
MPLRGDRLRELRQRRDYTQEELAEILDLGIRQIHRYESGETDPSGDIVARIAKLLGVTTDYLLGLVDEPDAHFSERDYSPMERKLITAVRKGRIVEALKTITTMSESIDESDVPPAKPAVNG